MIDASFLGDTLLEHERRNRAIYLSTLDAEAASEHIVRSGDVSPECLHSWKSSNQNDDYEESFLFRVIIMA